MKKLSLIMLILSISIAVNAQSGIGTGFTNSMNTPSSEPQGNTSRDPYSIQPNTDPFPQKLEGEQRMEENSMDKTPSSPLEKQKIKENQNTNDIVPSYDPSGTSTTP